MSFFGRIGFGWVSWFCFKYIFLKLVVYFAQILPLTDDGLKSSNWSRRRRTLCVEDFETRVGHRDKLRARERDRTRDWNGDAWCELTAQGTGRKGRVKPACARKYSTRTRNQCPLLSLSSTLKLSFDWLMMVVSRWISVVDFSILLLLFWVFCVACTTAINSHNTHFPKFWAD